MVDAYEGSGPRPEFSRSRGIKVTAFDYYQRRLRQVEEQEQEHASGGGSSRLAARQAPAVPPLARVQIAAAHVTPSLPPPVNPFVIAWANGRKIECGFWDLGSTNGGSTAEERLMA